MSDDQYFFPTAPVIDMALAERTLANPAPPPGGRPPSRLPGSEPEPPTGTTIPGNGGAQVTAAGIQKAAVALGITAAIGAAGYFLYQDHQKVTQARNAAASPTTKRRGRPHDDDDEDEDDDELPKSARPARIRRRWDLSGREPLRVAK